MVNANHITFVPGNIPSGNDDILCGHFCCNLATARHQKKPLLFGEHDRGAYTLQIYLALFFFVKNQYIRIHLYTVRNQ